MADKVRYLSQDVDYLGFLQTKLRDLRGVATLAYELIQNADDVRTADGRPGASQITFDIHDDALIVENDGTFEERDFTRVQNIASGGKREEEGTTGSFGIGFISVYQITDSPEIFSSGRHWQIRPEAKTGERIAERPSELAGTRFRFPWAFDSMTEVRKKLRLEALKPSQLRTFEAEILQALRTSALFLKQLRVLVLKHNGVLVRQIEREATSGDQVLIRDGDQNIAWQIFRGDFSPRERQLRDLYPTQIEAKRHSQVQVLISRGHTSDGQLFAVLPSDTKFSMPLHINADFFPTSDRKRIIFENDYQSQWNRAAVHAAASALRIRFDELPDLLGHKQLWDLLQKIELCKRDPRPDPVFGAFWDEIAPDLPKRKIVFTAGQRWLTPNSVRLLESPAEEAAGPILESMGIPTVHPDLRSAYRLMYQKEVGVPLLSAQDFAQGAARVGLNQRIAMVDAPAGLNKRKAWSIVWSALDALLDRRQTSDALEQAKSALGQCSIALGTDGALYPPVSIAQGDADTRALFTEIVWLDPTIPADKTPARLTPVFSAARAIAWLARLSLEEIKAEFQPARLYRWFEGRRQDILAIPEVVKKLQELPIWPSSGTLCPLTNLYIPGGFTDPLKLAALVDIEVLGGRREFLKDLGVPELDFRAYAGRLVPQVFAQVPDLPGEKRRELVQVLAQHVPEMLEDDRLKAALSALPLVECLDGQFYPARQVYTQPDVQTILGQAVHLVAPVTRNQPAITQFYEWLGARASPRPTDVIARVEGLIKAPPDNQALTVIQATFAHLADNWHLWAEPIRQQYAKLQKLTWLPSSRNPAQWYPPERLYTIFQSYLFETQANFLSLPRASQSQAATVGLADFLGLRTRPEPILIVRHLLECSEAGKPVNREVYRVLNDNADNNAVLELKGKACLLLADGRYVRPDQVYWSDHPFGRFRYQLGPDLRSYNALFNRLGVRDRPDDNDFIVVLRDISEQFGHNPLDEEAVGVVMRCWQGLSSALEAERLSTDELAGLQGTKVVVDRRAMLNLPENMFFEDRPGLAAKFHGFLDNSVIARPQGAWPAMAEVGVRLLLSQAVRVRLLECKEAIPDDALATRVAQRRPLLARVIEAERASSGEALNGNALAALQYERAQEVKIQYTIEAFRQSHSTEPEMVPALLLSESNTLVAVQMNGRPPWAAIARELAYAIKPTGEVGGLAGGIKEALEGESLELAERTLDELGYPPLHQWSTEETSTPTLVGALGGTEMTTEEALAAILGGQAAAPQPPPAGPSERPAGTPPATATGAEGPGAGQPGPNTEDGNGSPTAGTAPGAPGDGRPPKQGKSQGKLRSYVTQGDSEGGADPTSAGHRTEVDRAGVSRVLAYELARGRTPREMDHGNKGYDVESTDSEGHIRYIEVKSLSGEWSERDAAGMSAPQYDLARRIKNYFWLYVVDRALDNEYFQVHPIQDPATRVSQYLLDDGWQAVATYEDPI